MKITDAFGFSAIPAGYAGVGGGVSDFKGTYSYATFWTATEEGDLAVCRYFQESRDIVYRGKMSKTGFACPVRCVKEK